MIGRTRHLHDDRLHECYLADRSGEPVDPRAAEHLTDCAACATRYAAVAGFLDEIRREGALEADEIFGPERLEHQQAQIRLRIEHLSRPARVISFPGHPTSHLAGASARVAPRWLAAAAAAGLFVGVAVGGMFSGQRPLRASAPGYVNASTVPRVAPTPAVLVTTPTPTPSAEPIDDDRFLRELEVALERPHTRELLPIDLWTPHVREIGSRLR